MEKNLLDIALKEICAADLNEFDEFSYQNLSKADRQKLIERSVLGDYDGKFFKFFLVKKGAETMDVVNVFGHSKSVVSIAPEIKDKYRRKGYGIKTIIAAIEYAKTIGFKIAYAGIKESNLASITLHERLGFEYVQDFFSSHGNKLRLYVKLL